MTTAKAHDSSVKGGSQEKVLLGSDFELFCKGDYSSTDDLDEAKESYFP